MTGARKVRVDQHPNLDYIKELLAIRQLRGWTQKQLAIEIGVRRNTVSRWERGETAPNEAWMRLIRTLFPKSNAPQRGITGPQNQTS